MQTLNDELELDMQVLSDVYMISNTPAFLFKQFSSNQTIQEIVKRFSTDLLISKFLQVASKIDSHEEIVLAYALYISILNKRDEKAWDFVNQHPITFEWFPALSSIFKASGPPYLKIELEFKTDIKQKYNNYTISSGDVNVQNLEMV